MAKALKEFRIPFIGLKQGSHQYEFHLGDAFFEAFEYSEIEHADLKVLLELEKQTNMLVLHFRLNGQVQVLCDRCGDPVHQPISGKHDLIVKFGDHTSDTDDDLMELGPAESDIDVSQFLYEYTHLDLPVRHVHAELSECNQQVLAQLEKYRVQEAADSQWIALKNMHHTEELNDDVDDEFDFEEEE